MKNKMKTISIVLLIIALSFSSGGQMFGQEETTISAGIGYPDLLNIGLKFRVLNQANIGLNIGFFPSNNNTSSMVYWGTLLSFAGDFYYHFAGSSEYSEMRPWYGRIGINYMKDMDYPSNNALIPYLRIGRDFYLNKNDGISIDLGLGKVPIHEHLLFGPALGICYFHRF
jgi:hypothetical protein